MHSFLRFLLLGVFAAAGVALAVCLATTDDPSLAALSMSPFAAKSELPADVPPPPRPGQPVSSADRSQDDLASAGADTTPASDRQRLLAPTQPVIAEPNRPYADEVKQYDRLLDHAGEWLKQQQDTIQTLSQLQLAQLPPEPAPLPGPSAARDPFADEAAANTSFAPPLAAAADAPNGVQWGEGDDSLVVNVQDADIRGILDLLSQQGGLNILASPSVQGTVSASLVDADVNSALEAILRSTGYVAHRQGNYIYVGTPEDLQTMAHNDDRVGTRVYRPNYITAEELQSLIASLLTPEVGSVSVSTAAEAGIATDSASAGGDSYAGSDVLLVRDYEAALVQIDQIVEDVDRQPLQVAIEAMIISVKLDDTFKMGVDWDLFRDNDNMRLVLGTPPADLAAINVAEGGIKFGYLDGSLGAFLSAVETIGDANVIAAPRLLCLNKQRAEIHIGREVGYVSTTVTENAATETIEFLELGTQLRLRPFVAEDGMIRLEIHPELSTGDVEVREGFTIPDKDVTQVTTNVMIRDGATVVIGGLIREDLKNSTSQVPLLGSLPLAGVAFRRKTEEIDREEIIILITPHIVYEPKLACDGEQALTEYYHRQSIYRDKMSPIGTRFYGRRCYRLAAAAWANGDASRALRYINWSLQFDPMSVQATSLRAEIVSNSPNGDRNAYSHLREGLAPWQYPLGGRHLPFWIFDELGALPELNQPAPIPYDRGTPGSIRQIEPPTHHEPID